MKMKNKMVHETKDPHTPTKTDENKSDSAPKINNHSIEEYLISTTMMAFMKPHWVAFFSHVVFVSVETVTSTHCSISYLIVRIQY